MEYEWYRTNDKPKDCAQILVIIKRFDGKFIIQDAMFFDNIEGPTIYLFNDTWLDFYDIVGWTYYPKLPSWIYEE